MPIYLDNAATSFPKPESVYQAFNDVFRNIGANPGRSGHRWGIQANHIVADVREKIADFFNIPNPSSVVFTHNCTEAINLGIKGLLKRGDHVITTSMEHNSVLRPLRSLAYKGVETTIVECSREGIVDPDDVKKEIRKNTRLIVVTYASNATGVLMPIEEISRIVKNYGIVFMVDAAQSAGVIQIDVQKLGIDLLACPGHKALLGPQGTGFLSIGDGIQLSPLLEGGTGWSSELEEQPEALPEKFESGTLNTPALNGLGAGIDFIKKVGIENIKNHENHLISELNSRLYEIEEIEVYGLHDHEKKTGIFSFNIKGLNPSDAGFILDNAYDILTRVGLHCAPVAHRTLGTFPYGFVRVSVGHFNTIDEIELFCEAIGEIIRQL
ncbi:MAG: aminotransferase class V-fold PLP-dependent enzyme [Thermodesulfobacteriota bacterium]|nr:aminotransferase class V-fold PLP-dependent enzyme [Thermodesulfobacteriota bacterium]